MSRSHNEREQVNLVSRTISNISGPVSADDASTMVRLLAISKRD